MAHSPVLKKDKQPLSDEVENRMETVYRMTVVPAQDSPDEQCGIGSCRPQWMQIFARKNVYIFVFGLLGAFQFAATSYTVASLSTWEKRFKLTSSVTGFITVGNDLSQVFLSIFIGYYGGRGHRPQWLAGGIGLVGVACLFLSLPHLIYGPGQEALDLTEEYLSNKTAGNAFEPRRVPLCDADRYTHDDVKCIEGEGESMFPAVLLFVAHVTSGIGSSVYFTLGLSYLDDNVKRTQSPFVFGITFFIRTLGPPMGFFLASVCLRMYIDPTLTPVITNKDPRWMGAWWLGFLVLGFLIIFLSLLIAFFPKMLPKTAQRKREALAASKNKRQISTYSRRSRQKDSELDSSFPGTLKRVLQNKILIFNCLSTVFYFLGEIGYWTFMPKYMETQFAQSASMASALTGSVGLSCTAIGVLVSGVIISRIRPRARILAAWNVIVGTTGVAVLIVYASLHCPLTPAMPFQLQAEGSACISDCACAQTKYSPVCATSNVTGIPVTMTYFSPCYAGCTESHLTDDKRRVFQNCACASDSYSSGMSTNIQGLSSKFSDGNATDGPCRADCFKQFLVFLIAFSVMKLFNASGKAGNFLVGCRCVRNEDKSMALGVNTLLLNALAFLPGPVIYGAIIDSTCQLWESNCGEKGNCWIYDRDQLRFIFNFTAAGLIFIGTILDFIVWYLVDDLNIYEEDIPETEYAMALTPVAPSEPS